MEAELQEIMALAMAENWEEARKKIDALLFAHPEEWMARVVKADIETLSGNRKEAFRMLREIIRDAPRFAPAHYSMGVLHGREGRWDQAKTSFEEALAFYDAGEKEGLSDAWLQLGIALWEKRNPEEALTAWGTALQLNPGQWKAREYIENFTSDWTRPQVQGNPAWFETFKEYQIRNYLAKSGKEKFSSLEETGRILKRIVDAWSRIPDKWKLVDISPEERNRLFQSMNLFL